MKVRITENYTSAPKVIEYDMEIKEMKTAVDACSKLLKDIPYLKVVTIVCLDPKEKITITR